MQEKFQPTDRYIFDWKGGLILVVGYVISQLVLGGAMAFGMQALHKNYMYSIEFLVIGYVITMIIPILLYEMVFLRQKEKYLYFNFRILPVSSYLIIFPMMLGGIFIAEYFTSLLPTEGGMMEDLYKQMNELISKLSNDHFAMILMTSVFAPILEEIMFRGIIQKGMINNGVKPMTAIIIASIVFGLVHANPWQFVGGVLLGLILGVVYYKTGSLLASILLHSFNNLISCLLMILAKKESFSEFFGIPEWQILSIGLVLLVIFGFFFIKKYKTPVLL